MSISAVQPNNPSSGRRRRMSRLQSKRRAHGSGGAKRWRYADLQQGGVSST